MKLVVTGPTSFLGAAFVRAAQDAGHAVIALTRRRTRWLDEACQQVIERDILDVTEADLGHGVDAVIHFATGSDGPDDHVIRVAVDGTRALFEAAMARGIASFFHVSSMSVYPGPVQAQPGIAGVLALEPHPARRGVYAASKTMAEDALRQLAAGAAGRTTDLVILRPGLVFGHGMKSPLAGSAVALPLGLLIGMGRPGQTVPLVDIDDLTGCMIRLLDLPPTSGGLQVYDVLSGPPPTKRDFLAEYCRLTGQPHRAIHPPRWCVLPAGWLADRWFAIRKRPRHLAYKIRRLYAFDPADLPHRRIWDACGGAPRSGLLTALTASLTARRDPAPDPENVQHVQGIAAALIGGIVEVRGARAPDSDLVLVGAGGIVGEMHIPALKGLDGIRVRAVVDRDRRAAETVARRFAGAKVAGDIADLDDAMLDGATAVIATPGASHAALGLAALDRGASVLLEKPAALDRAEFSALDAASLVAGRPVSVFHNYRLRPNTLRLWRWLAAHDVGALVAADVTFHAAPLTGERARWMMEEKRHRVLVLEQAIHFIDIACTIGGALEELEHVAVTDDSYGRATIAVRAAGRLSDGADLRLDLDLSGTARRAQVALEFERAACVLDFYPEGFRVLPRGNTPIDDIGAAAWRLAGFATQRLLPNVAGVPKRALPHLFVYYRHLTQAAAGDAVDNPFSLTGVGDTMRSLYLLCDHVYGAPAGAPG